MKLPQSAREVLLLHHPECSKSQRLRALLEQRGVGFVLRDLLADPLTRSELADLAQRLCLPAHEWVRQESARWSELGISFHAELEQVLDAIARFPELLQRPILVRGDLAAVGRPAERALEILGG